MNTDLQITEIVITIDRQTQSVQGAAIRYWLPDGSAQQHGGLSLGAQSPVVQDALGVALASALEQVEDLQAQAASVPTLEGQIATLQAEKAALHAQLDAILNPPPSPVDWVGFRTAIAANPAYLRIASHNLTTTVLDSKLTWVLGAGEFDEVPALWNAIAQIAQPTSEEIATLNALAAQYQVPFQLDGAGLMPA